MITASNARPDPQRCCYWFTGLPSAGKTTLARSFSDKLRSSGKATLVLDGDMLRQGLNGDLGFSSVERAESVRRAAEIARVAVDEGLVALAALVSPYRDDREHARHIVGAHRFFEVFVDADLRTCMRRDLKSLYRLAKKGTVANLTGVSDPYEPPLSPALRLDTSRRTIAQCLQVLVNHYTCLQFESATSSSGHVFGND